MLTPTNISNFPRLWPSACTPANAYHVFSSEPTPVWKSHFISREPFAYYVVGYQVRSEMKFQMKYSAHVAAGGILDEIGLRWVRVMAVDH